MIAPEPFFEPRGTPFSEYFRIKAISDLGYQVDLVTYPIGEDKNIRGLKIFRSWKPFFIKSVKTGPSINKVILDFFLFFKVIGRLIKGRYQIIHTHEEANIMGVIFNKITKIPHLYDMHSSLVQQMSNFKFTKSKLVIGIFRFIEKVTLKNANSIIVICKALHEYANKFTQEEKLTLIENFMDDTPSSLNASKLNRLKKKLNLGEKTLIIYTGTLEAYQGISLLIESLNYLENNFCLILIGGKKNQITMFKNEVKEKKLDDRVKLIGQKISSDIPYYLKLADVLVSPRTLGTNIPLKIYSYLKSGVPVVATNLYTHTQSLTSDIAILVEPKPDDLARGIREAAGEKGKRIADNAARFCAQHYSYKKYLSLVNISLKKAIN
jgi:glycosyltransferase involved in cell wall biosynthesis